MKTALKQLAILILLFLGISIAYAANDAALELKPSVTEVKSGEEFTVDIVLKNPSQQSVISVRSWLTYDKAKLEAVNIDSSASSFTLAAPGEDQVSQGEGKVKIGRSNIAGGVKEAETTVATVRFKVLEAYEATTAISFYDYQASELGHTSVNIIDQGFPANILFKAPDSLQVKLNAGAGSAPAVQPAPTPQPQPQPTPTDVGGGFAVDMARPVNLKANTGSGYVDLMWQAEVDAARVGFNVYYGKQSGTYTRRRTVGNVGSVRIDNLMNNETYYFAVTAYDQYNRESDYSNEVGIIVNQPLSSTSPFEGLLSQVSARIPSQPQNGPLAGWLVFSAAGLAGSLVFGRKKHK
ncbi:hypothetical protein JW752_01215 [Candidatus Peregrinibacteria bacterium]|nr:hypothetical protein [Candidatus Peregrinibacteria bacterium]